MRSAAGSPFTKRIDSRALAYVRKRGVIRANETIVVGVSGGPDSTALLLILSRLRDELGLRIVVAHFDHMLRSREEADGDRAFVEKLARSRKIEFVSGGGDVRARARRAKESVEEAARYMRYRFLGREARRVGATAVAVGHTLDDRAETVLQHVIRGAGLDGLAAMPPRAPWPFGRGPEIARPLLELSRADTERYCREMTIEARRDPTNDILIATRNRVRHELMPVLRSFNPRIAEALVRLADAAGRDLAFIEGFLESTHTMYSSRNRDGIALQRTYLERLDPALTSRDLKRAAAQVSRAGVELDWSHVERVLDGLAKRRTRVSLPGGLVAVIDPFVVTIWPGAPPRPAPVPHLQLRSSGETHAGSWTIESRYEQATIENEGTGPCEVCLDDRAIRGWLSVRSRQEGDRLRPLGLGGSKKVQDILVDAKVPREERDGVPIICDDKGIVWVVGHCIDERVAVRPGARRVLRLRATYR